MSGGPHQEHKLKNEYKWLSKHHGMREYQLVSVAAKLDDKLPWEDDK